MLFNNATLLNLGKSCLLNSILYLNSVDTYYLYYFETLSGQIYSLNNNLNTYSSVTNLMNNVIDLNYDIISLSGRIQNYYVEQCMYVHLLSNGQA